MLKTILLSISITAFSLIGYSQSEAPIELIETTAQNSYILEFENQREFDINKLSRFTDRLENHYEEITSIEYDIDNNLFKIFFTNSPSELPNLEDMLSHFNVYNFTITK